MICQIFNPYIGIIMLLKEVVNLSIKLRRMDNTIKLILFGIFCWSNS